MGDDEDLVVVVSAFGDESACVVTYREPIGVVCGAYRPVEGADAFGGFGGVLGDVAGHGLIAEFSGRGDWPNVDLRTPGEPFPSIGELADRFDAAKMTVDRAVDILRSEGYLGSRQGSRTTVIAVPEAQPDDSGDGQEQSEEFRVLFGQLQEIRGQIQTFAAKLEELDERTKNL
ncbi:GntR family transcriptional regulator [Actinomadura sp. DC4]|nr:GntR family transcriptional regulator [Actinomadura sp. DC4]MDN3355884.1 GntR family transcriptional regulator [Actinomadura sp. DC4]